MTVNTNLFATTFFTLTGFHGLHVTVGLVALGIVLGARRWRATSGASASHRRSRRRACYWHFVDAVWIVVFTVVYVRAR